MSFGLSGGLDYKLGEKFTGGAVFGLNNFSGYDDSAMMIEIGFLLKAWIMQDDSKFIFRPGFGISYGMLGSIGGLDSSNYMVLNGVAELIILTENNFNYLIALGVTGGPTGGNDDYEMTYGPGFFLRGGVAF